MATRTIVTSQPDVACDVCARRLLRGEHHDVFVSAGRRRIVCELCAPRAAHAGWLRETDTQAVSLPPARARRAGGLLERLRRVAQPGASQAQIVDSPEEPQSALAEAPTQAPSAAFDQALLPSATPVDAPTEAPELAPTGELNAVPAVNDPQLASANGHAPLATETHADTVAQPAEPSPYLQAAVDVFNASEFPRRVAGVIRSLGAPLVTVRSAEHLQSVVRIVVAWELCWYCYEIDLSEPAVEAQVISQGTELAELAREDRLGNAAAADSGALALADAA
jgi:hypothetical protein